MEIKLENVSYDDGMVKNNLSLKFKDNKITFVVGYGKSELLSLINGDLKYDGEVIKRNVKRVGFLRQNPEEYFFCNTIYDEFLFKIKKERLNNLDYRKIVNCLKMVGLNESFLKRSPFEISKGEQKRVGLALTLLDNPKLLILDDVFSNLDSLCQKQMIKLFRMLKLRYGKTIIISASNMDVVLELADEVICLKDGNLFFQGDKIDFFTNDDLLDEVKISKPKIIEFIDLVKKRKKINLGYRDDINDLMKDIYRFK